MVKSYLVAQLRVLDPRLDSIARAKAKLNLEEQEAALLSVEQEKNRGMMANYIEIWRNFEELCFGLEHVGKKMSFREIQTLSVYEFYRYKDFVQRINKPQSTHGKED